MRLRPLVTCLCLALALPAFADTQVLPLNNRSSADLLPVAREFLGKDGTVNAYGNQLIVNAEPRRIEDLRQVLNQLDTPARRLMISVDTRESVGGDRISYGINGQQQGRIVQYGTASRDGNVQQVQATEGTPALIQIGQSIPVTSSRSDGYGRVERDTQYRNVTQGFYVTASVSGQTAHLSITTNRDRLSQERPDAIRVQSTDSQVSGPVGQWITLAAQREANGDLAYGPVRSYSTEGRDDMVLRVKVDLLN